MNIMTTINEQENDDSLSEVGAAALFAFGFGQAFGFASGGFSLSLSSFSSAFRESFGLALGSPLRSSSLIARAMFFAALT